MSLSKFASEKAALNTQARLFFANPHNTRHVPFCSPEILSFSMYPICDADVAENEFLWRVVQDSSFELSTGRRALSRRLAISGPNLARIPATLFALALPEPLAAFLEVVSLEEMHHSIIYMIADAIQVEDDDIRHTMCPTISRKAWAALKRVELFMRSTRDFADIGSWYNGSPIPDIASHTANEHDYWEIDVEAALFVPMRHAALKVWKNDARRASVMASLYADYAAYVELSWEILLTHTRKDGSTAREARNVALESMMSLVKEGRQSEAWDRVSALRQCADNEQSWFSKLPIQVIEHLLVPRVVSCKLDHSDEKGEGE